MIEGLLLILGYLAGSVSAGILVARALGLGDPREAGSGNPGATNVLRLGGRRAAAITLLVDALKGVIPVLIAHAAGLSVPWLAAVGLAAFIGHLYPVFFGFRGGKGVATGFGVLLAWSWPVGVAALLTWAVAAGLVRISSVGALASFLLAPVYCLVLVDSPTLAAATAVMTALIVWRHRGNIQRLINGTEGRLGRS
ncbi:glycerol-3-phosphate 1-O-acyltransferase PlsY [Spiribacter sp. 2438]|uniref:glycerol-3-phosphate 1-O-acyltransferase PlsY n=1 Tax=Spiribacter sp. 2438 TaxID=2666185 RepID=UPI0012B0FDD9|nr:glycerol-3-phosphate 1-O-acyltransferase PlsY [Spiribacter sp. 2438]QGM20921.1 glycerol-3-phosphate 1-O-acyltransferase PlsY [Spiribacter sp. 2438]